MSAFIHQEVVFKASPNRIYTALMNSKEHGDFTGGPLNSAPKRVVNFPVTTDKL